MRGLVVPEIVDSISTRHPTYICGYGGIGRHARFRFWYLIVWEFESPYPYHFRVGKVSSFGSRSVKPTLRGVERNHTCPPCMARSSSGQDTTLSRWRSGIETRSGYQPHLCEQRVMMPVKPGKNETQEEFISRCVSEEIKRGHEQAQAVAICYSKWKERRRKELNEEI